jgi:hypothetical protein
MAAFDVDQELPQPGEPAVGNAALMQKPDELIDSVTPKCRVRGECRRYCQRNANSVRVLRFLRQTAKGKADVWPWIRCKVASVGEPSQCSDSEEPKMWKADDLTCTFLSQSML